MTYAELEAIGKARWGNRWITPMAEYLSVYRSTIYGWQVRGVPIIKAKKVNQLKEAPQ